MKTVFLKKNDFKSYNSIKIKGYSFKPRNKGIKGLNIVDESLIKFILLKKIKREINKTEKTISLMLESDITIVTDCELMIKEIYRIVKKLEKRYRSYFNEFEYFELVKNLYSLNMEILLKKKLIEESEL